MGGFILGFILGGCVGIAIMALLSAASEKNDDLDDIDLT